MVACFSPPIINTAAASVWIQRMITLPQIHFAATRLHTDLSHLFLLHCIHMYFLLHRYTVHLLYSSLVIQYICYTVHLLYSTFTKLTHLILWDWTLIIISLYSNYTHAYYCNSTFTILNTLCFKPRACCLNCLHRFRFISIWFHPQARSAQCHKYQQCLTVN